MMRQNFFIVKNVKLDDRVADIFASLLDFNIK
jgi:hypothetical protein